MKFQTNFEREPQAPEKGGGVTKTEKRGYIPAKIRIEDMILAGKRLVESRAARFDYQEGPSEEEEEIDPTRVRNFDMADAHQLAMGIEARGVKTVKKSEKAPDKPKKVDQEKPEGLKE